MSSQVLHKAKVALEQLNAEALTACYGEECLFEDTTSAKTIRTKKEVLEMYRRLFTLPSVRFSEVVVWEGSGWAAVEWTWSGRSQVSGTPFRIRGASVIELRGGTIARETLYYDPRPFLA